MHQTDLIEQIKERREVLQLTQEALAELAGVGLRTLKEIESGKGNPTLDTIQKLMDVLGLELVLKVRKMNTKK
jgi:y4mF family transcriptional regulator